MTTEKIKIKSSPELNFVKIVEDEKPLDSEYLNKDSEYVFFCKDCKAVVKTVSKVFRGKNEETCEACGSYNVVSGIKSSLEKHFRIK